jgi:hypothetical protein
MVDPFELPPPTLDAAAADALSSVYDAGAVRVPPWMAVVAALATVRPADVDGCIAWLLAHRRGVERAYGDGRAAPLAAAALPAGMHDEPELGGLDRSREDHALRERHLFADVVGRWTFTQSAIYAMTGIELSASDAEMLDQFGNANLVVDRRAWPVAVARRIAARGGGYPAAVVGGIAMMGAPIFGGVSAEACARFLLRARAAELEGRPVAELIADALSRKEHIMGFGRPVVGPDERVPILDGILRRHGRAELPYVTLVRAAEEAFVARKGLRSTAAAWVAAACLDLGMTPAHVHAIANYWVTVCIYAQALFSEERGFSGNG